MKTCWILSSSITALLLIGCGSKASSDQPLVLARGPGAKLKAVEPSLAMSEGTLGVTACLQDWRNTTCGNWCTRETQWDRKHCTVFLDCYFQNGTGPTSNPDATCGVNKFPYGMAPKTIADQVYQCLGCPGSTPLTSCANAPDTAPCTDGNECTTNDRCLRGSCVSNSSVSCRALDQCHDAGTCDPLSGNCSNPIKRNGTSCDDASICTRSDQCQQGSCVGTPVVCPAVDACHPAGVCSPLDGTCNSPVGAGCTVSSTPRWTSAPPSDNLLGAVVPRADGTALAAGQLGAYRLDSSGNVTPIAPAMGKRFVIDPTFGLFVGVIEANAFVLYDSNGVRQTSVELPAAASAALVPGRAMAALRLMSGSTAESMVTSAVRFVGEGRDVTFPVADLRRSFFTKDYHVYTTSNEIVVHDHAGTEVHRFATAADLMAASSASSAFAFVAHGSMNVITTRLPAGPLGPAIPLDGPVWNLALSPDGRFMAATTKQKVYLFLDGVLASSVAVPVDYINSADVSNEGLVVLGTQNQDQSTRIYGLGLAGVNGFSLDRPSRDPRGYHPDVRFAPGGRSFVSSERDGATTFDLSLTR